ncbi:MAG: hypothetical protein SynsKO_00370 [Synoicihabitans sp.]
MSSIVLLASGLSAIAQTESSVQSTARPFGLDITAPVQIAGSDEASASFQEDALPVITDLINTQLGENVQFNNQTAYSLDPTKLRLATESTARVYFVGEGAGYRNTLGFNALPAGADTPETVVTADSELIFPDSSSSVSTYDPASSARRYSRAPLLPGDFVDMGTFAAGTTLDFFLIANGANGGRNAYSAPATRNPDQLDHVVSFVLPDSPYLIIGFEDLFGGGDKDYNDLVFAVDIGAANLQKLISTPEPSTWAIMFGCLGWVYWTTSRRRVATNLDTA